MQYEFPIDLKLDEVRAAISETNAVLGARVFIEARRADFIVFNYIIQTPNSFPNPALFAGWEARKAALLRECRGLCFGLDGNVIRRPYAKFFNINERPETQVAAIDWSQDHIVLDKLDGSLISPIFMPNSEMQWHILDGWPAQEVRQFASEPYKKLAEFCQNTGLTPLFEWVSPTRRIVLNYDESNMIMTGARNIHTGAYASYDELTLMGARFGVPVVRSFGRVTDVAAAIEQIAEMQGEEGRVIRFASGHQVKGKSRWYRTIHKMKDAIVEEKDVYALVISGKVDDVKPFLTDIDRAEVEQFENDFHSGVARVGARLRAILDAGKARFGDDRRAFADWLNNQPLHKLERGIVHAIGKGEEPSAAIRKCMRIYTGSGPRIEEVRFLTDGARWKTRRRTQTD